MKISILGSTGFVGRVLVEKALDQGYEIKTLVRSPNKLGELNNRLDVIEGDYFNADDLEKTVKGTKVVLSTVGPPMKNPKYPEKYEQSMQHLVAAMEGQSITRLIHTGGAVHSGGEDEHWTIGRRLLKLFLVLFWKPGLDAKRLEWEVLKKSNLDWTLVRPPRIIEGKSSTKLQADEKNLASVQVNVENLVEFMLEQLTSTQWIKKAPLAANG